MSTEPIAGPITRFVGTWAFLSNFYPAQLDWDGVTYRTAEHAFQAGKTMDAERRMWIAQAKSPSEAKQRGQRVRPRPDWDTVSRYQVMLEVLRAKFGCDPERIRRLMLTGDRDLIEGNNWHDTHWGVCWCPNHRVGENHLGRLLMQVREELR